MKFYTIAGLLALGLGTGAAAPAAAADAKGADWITDYARARAAARAAGKPIFLVFR